MCKLSNEGFEDRGVKVRAGYSRQWVSQSKGTKLRNNRSTPRNARSSKLLECDVKAGISRI